MKERKGNNTTQLNKQQKTASENSAANCSSIAYKSLMKSLTLMTHTTIIGNMN